MHIFRHIEEVPGDYGPTVVSVGNFDGVHRAHTRVLAEIAARARRRSAKSVAVTFEPHPMRILRPDSGLTLLTPTPQKIRLLQQAGIDAVALMPPRDFVRYVLCDGLNAAEVHEGYNFHFGHKAAGNVNLLTELGSELGFEVVVY